MGTNSSIQLPSAIARHDPAAADMTEAGLLDSLRSHLRGKGLYYPDWLPIDLYLSLKAKPFVILCGLSGSGKTRLAIELAEALGQSRLVAIRPSWDDVRDLFGHRDVLTGLFSPSDAYAAVAAANKSPDTALSLILDEMNLARVEHYFSDVLSVLESRAAGLRKTAQFTVAPAYGAHDAETVTWSRNILLMGTVNVDESTKGISPKVLARANVIEFPVPSPKAALAGLLAPSPGLTWSPSQWYRLGEIAAAAPPPLELVRDGSGSIKARLVPVVDRIDRINSIVSGAGLGVSLRVTFEVLAFVEHGLAMLDEAKALGIRFDGPDGTPLDETALCDFQWQQRILPHLTGPRDMLDDVLCDLESWFRANGYLGSEQRTSRLRKMDFVHFQGAW